MDVHESRLKSFQSTDECSGVAVGLYSETTSREKSLTVLTTTQQKNLKLEEQVLDRNSR